MLRQFSTPSTKKLVKILYPDTEIQVNLTDSRPEILPVFLRPNPRFHIMCFEKVQWIKPLLFKQNTEPSKNTVIKNTRTKKFPFMTCYMSQYSFNTVVCLEQFWFIWSHIKVDKYYGFEVALRQVLHNGASCFKVWDSNKFANDK